MSKSKKGGLGVNALFGQQAPAPKEAPGSTQPAEPSADPPQPNQDPQPPTEQSANEALVVSSESEPAAASDAKKKERLKIRNTFVIYEDTMKILEMLVLMAERKKVGKKTLKVTYSALIEEAVQALVEKKSQDEDFHKKLQALLE